jgi:hypothetical protein
MWISLYLSFHVFVLHEYNYLYVFVKFNVINNMCIVLFIALCQLERTQYETVLNLAGFWELGYDIYSSAICPKSCHIILEASIKISDKLVGVEYVFTFCCGNAEHYRRLRYFNISVEQPPTWLKDF